VGVRMLGEEVDEWLVVEMRRDKGRSRRTKVL
jgi:hypothetical protein